MHRISYDAAAGANMKPVWIVDDDQAIRWVLEKALEKAGIQTVSFAGSQDVEEALDNETPAAIVSDIRMPGMNGLVLLKKIKARFPDLPVIIMTAHTDLQSTVSAFQDGAFDFLAKPFDVNEAVSLVSRALHDAQSRAQPELNTGEKENESQVTSPTQHGAPTTLLTQSSSAAMQEVFRAIGRLAQSSVTVLITGQSGTGKELVARALHNHSARKSGPFVALNTAAIPRDLLEAELFGHERGAFTGASALRRGRFEEASTGTLFLDEIGDMPLELQTRLLRVLSEGTFYRVGGTQAIKVDVRIIAATHQPLEQRVLQGKFREDLFHRLNVIRLRLPALRERRDDIETLARHFLVSSARALNIPAKVLTPKALEKLKAFDYPGNVRQLENFCHWLTVMAPGQTIGPNDLPPELIVLEVALPVTASNAAEVGFKSNPQITTTEKFEANQLSTSITLPSAVYVGSSSHQTSPEPHTQASNTGMVGYSSNWAEPLSIKAEALLRSDSTDIWGELSREFDQVLIEAALKVCKGRRVEAANRLGMGRNTITRKLRELNIDSD
jgi:two-component system nitrogen regulation response regulator GlnG